MIKLPACMYHYDGRSLDVHVPEQFRGMVQAFFSRNRAYISLEISRPGKPRTTGEHSQNAHINGHIQQISAELGQDFDTVKMALKIMAMKERGYPFHMIGGEMTPKSESEITTEEAALLIDQIHHFASEWQLRLIEREE